MADQDLNNNAAPEVGGNDTKTRKTVRLTPSVAPVSGLKLPGKDTAAGTTIADPLANRDTDTGNLEVLDDTQTRRTVKLKPLRPAGANTPGLDLSGENTNTRKSVVLKPASAVPGPVDGGNTNTRKTVVLKPASAPSVPLSGSEDTQTRKTVVLKPASGVNIPLNKPAAEPAPAPAPAEEPAPAAEPAPAPAPAPVDDATQVNTKIKPAVAPGISIEPVAAPADLNDDRTVKIQRPTRAALKPVATPVPPKDDAASRATVVLPDESASAETVALDEGSAASRATVVLPDVDEDTATQQNAVLRDNAANETVSLTTQDLTEAAAAAAGEKIAEELPVIDNTSAQTVSFDEDDLQQAEDTDSEESAETASAGENSVLNDVVFETVPEKGSPVYFVLILLTLLAMAFTATVTTLDYLGTWQGVKVDLPIPGLLKR